MKEDKRKIVKEKQYYIKERENERKREKKEEREGVSATHTSTPSTSLFFLKDKV